MFLFANFLSGARRKREVPKETFSHAEVMVKEPKQINGNLQVELAVIKRMSNGSISVISGANLARIVNASAAEIGHKLGGTLLSVMSKFPGPTAQATQSTMPVDNSTTITQKQPQDSTTVPGTTTGQVPASPGSAAANKGGGDNGGVIGGVVVASLVIIILVIALAVWYFR